MFTQPVLSGFTFQALPPWIHKCLHFIVLSPYLTLYDALCYLYTIFFQLWFPQEKKKPGGLVFCKWLVGPETRKQLCVALFLCSALCVLLFLVLAGNSAQFQTLRSYILLLKSPVLMHSWRSVLSYTPMALITCTDTRNWNGYDDKIVLGTYMYVALFPDLQS